jgi:outer membrane autotransporter protein
MAPRGARGPRRRRGQLESQIRGWGKYYGSYYTRSEEGLYPSYESGLNGVVLGIDASIEKLIVGISGGAGSYETTFNNDAIENTTASYGSLYGTYVAERGYLDAGVAYGINQVETQTAEPFRLDGDFDAQVANVYLGGGIDLIDTKGGTVFTPEASIQYAKYKQDAYTETGTAAVPRVFDEFDADSLLSSLGINVAMEKKKAMKTVAFQLDGRLHWMHEFNADPSDINFMLAGGSNQYRLNYPALDEEIYRIGIGCSFFNTGRRKPKNVVFRVDFDELFGDGFNSHNISAKLTYAF